MWVEGGSLPQAFSNRGPTRATLHGISDGLAGAAETLRAMKQLAKDGVRDPSQQIREAALSIIGNAGWVGQARALQSWIQDNIRYVQDPADDSGGIELVQTPQYTLQHRAGDCDDQSVLIASMLSAIGHPARFVAVGFNNQPLSHVLVQTKMSNTGNESQDWATVETIIPKPLGWFPAGVTSRYILKV